MELQYTLTKEDFVAFNMYYIDTDPTMVRAAKRNRFLIPALLMGLAAYFIYQGGWVRPVICGGIAVLWLLCYPMVERLRIRLQMSAMLGGKMGANVLGERTLTLKDDELVQMSASKTTRCTYGKIQKIESDAAHYYIYLGVGNAFIVPFRAFASGEEQHKFFDLLNDRIAHAPKEEPAPDHYYDDDEDEDD